MSAIPTELPPERRQLIYLRSSTIWKQNFPQSESARARLAAHGLSDHALLERLQVGFSNGKLPEILPPDASLKQDITDLGILTPKGRERFAQSLIFPVFSAQGEIANFLAWTPDGEVKRVSNLPLPPWNLPGAKSAATVYVTASLPDALALMASGEAHVIAVQPGQTQFDAEALQTFGVQQLIAVHGDAPASQPELAQLLSALGAYPHTVALLPGASRPSAMLLSRGAKAVSEELTKARYGLKALSVPGMTPVTDGLSLLISNRCYEVRGLQVSQSKLRVTLRIERGPRWHVDTLDLYSSRARRQLIVDVVRVTEESADTVEADIMRLMTACELRAKQPDMQIEPVSTNAIPEGDRKEGEAMGKDPNLFEIVADDFERYGVVGERSATLVSFLAMTSRKMARPVSVLAESGSAGGKSTVQDAVCAFCPPEDVVRISSLSPKALFHREKNSLRHKFLAIEEAAGAHSAGYALRVLISAGELVCEVATKDSVSGRLISSRNHVSGPVAVSLTTTSPDTDPETKSRFLVLCSNESTAQTQAILEHQRKLQTLDGLMLPEVRRAMARRHHAYQRLLQPVHVVNPLVEKVAGMSARLSARRNQPKLLGLIGAIAFCRQMQKPIKQYRNVNYIEVDLEDLKIATRFIRDLFSPAAGEISRPARDLLVMLDVMRKEARQSAKSGNGEEFIFSRRDVREHSKWERTRVHRYLRELTDLEFVLRDRSRRGMAERYTLAWDGDLTFGASETIMPFDDLTGPSAANPSPAAA